MRVSQIHLAGDRTKTRFSFHLFDQSLEVTGRQFKICVHLAYVIIVFCLWLFWVWRALGFEMRCWWCVLLLVCCSVGFAGEDPGVYCKSRAIYSHEDIPAECQKGDLIWVNYGAAAYLCDLTQLSMSYEINSLCVYRGEPRKTRQALEE
jgi:hypothetical protein